MFASLQPLIARRPHMALNMLVESTVYCFEPLRCILDAVELGDFSKFQQVTEPLGALDAPFEEGCVAVDCHCSDASFYLVVIRTDASELACLLQVLRQTNRIRQPKVAGNRLESVRYLQAG